MFLKSKIIQYCKQNSISTNIEYAVSIPASFEANQRQDLMEALARNGMTVARQSLIDEPNAAFLSYIQESVTTTDDKHKIVVQNTYNPKVLVFDFGGGTCDISILEIGKGLNGFYSKNLSISKFEKLGGDDIDRYISYHYLMPQLLEANGKKLSDFRIPDKRFIANQLYKIAESLKILICKDIANMKQDSDKLPVLSQSNAERDVNIRVDIDTKHGHLTKEGFTLTYKQFTETMKVFTKKADHNFRIGEKDPFVTKVKGEDDYNSIFNPITSALKKAHLNKDLELDYILLIGGSSKNPYVQTAIADYFEESEILLPTNLQTHVSKGTAIHSLIMNGFGKNIIQPITSEPIIVLTKNKIIKILIPAGTQIPCDTVTITDLITSRERQNVVELPICIGNEDKMLYNIRIPAPNGGTFHEGEQIVLTIGITADKVLKIDAICRGIHITPQQLNPFANKEMSNDERAVIKAERDVERSSSENNSIPTKSSLDALIRAYDNAGNKYQAAETMEAKGEYYLGSINYNYLGILYSNSDNNDKAIEAYEIALEKDPNSATINHNLAMQYECSNFDLFSKYVEKAYKISPDDPIYMMDMAKVKSRRNDKVDARKLKEKAYDIYLEKFRTHSFESWDYSWFLSLANSLGHHDIALKILEAESKKAHDSEYNIENLPKIRETEP